MIHILICDDDKHFRLSLNEIICKKIQLMGLSYKISEHVSGEALVADQTYGEADIIFLDIEMNELNGIQTAKLIRQKNKHAVIIFVTAFPNFVFQGYEVRALNYILKPYNEAQILTVLDVALDDLQKKAPQYYLIEQKAGSVRLALNDTYYFASDRRKIKAVTSQESISFYHKLDQLEQEVPDFFIRIHNRYLINLNYLSQLEGNTAYCGSDPLPVSRQYKQKISVAFANKVLGR